jgi:hypothetical protein
MHKSELQRITVYLDCDGVLADFNRYAIEKLGKMFNTFPDSQSAWDAMHKHQNVYMDLEPMPDAFDLVKGVFELKKDFGFRVGVLTAIPKIGRIPEARQHKIYWILKHFPELRENFAIGPHAEHKQYHCRAGDVLIDDSQKNIPQWNSKSGFGILHTSASQSISELSYYFNELTHWQIT